MKPYEKIYCDYFDFKSQSEIMCEACMSPAQDIHHINGRGPDKDVISNLMALCRKCHARAHGDKNYVSKGEFQLIHNYFLQGTRKQFLQ